MARRDEARQRLAERARVFADQRCLLVDYYRIRRKVAYPLPLRDGPEFTLALDFQGEYPWETWLAWALEERLWALGEAANFADNAAWRELADEGLRDLAAWNRWHPDTPRGLHVGHFARTMTVAADRWDWLPAETRLLLQQSCRRLVDRYRAWLDEEKWLWGERLASPGSEAASRPLGNIHYIGSVGLCLAARLAGHELAGWLEEHIAAFTEAIWEQRAATVTEAVCYDGYVLDFALDWAGGAPPELSARILDHPVTTRLLEQSAVLGAPGRLQDVARLGDVEPVEMPFHLSAHAKARELGDFPVSDWLLARVDLSWLRADALARLAGGTGPIEGAPPADAVSTWSAMVCRTGWELGDRAVAMAAHGDMGHLHLDNGSITIAAAGQWLINDPGYQQYLRNREREYTMGPRAHNCPVLDGRGQSVKAGVRLMEPALAEGGAWHLAMDLAPCYEPAPATCQRDVWLLADGTVLVRDTVEAEGVDTLAWHWHGHPDAAWWAVDGLALTWLPGAAELWIRCVGVELRQEQIDRQKGSRGALTLALNRPSVEGAETWWCFGARERIAAVSVEAGRAKLDGRWFGEPVG